MSDQEQQGELGQEQGEPDQEPQAGERETARQRQASQPESLRGDESRPAVHEQTADEGDEAQETQAETETTELGTRF